MIRRRLKELIFGRLGWFPYYGARVHFPSGSYVFQLACRQGVYEQDNVRTLLRLVEPGSTLLDVGANIGLMALPVLLAVPDSRVISFEPSPGTAPFLERTVEGSRYGKRWEAVPKAIGASSGEAEFHVAGAGMGAFDGLHDTRRAGVPMRSVRVPVTTIDEEWTRLGTPRVSAMKIDVEGVELEVIRGARRCIEANQPHLLVEWNESNSRAAGSPPHDLLAVAKEIGYGVYALPSMSRVVDAEDLRVHMLFTEDFLLSARHRSAH